MAGTLTQFNRVRVVKQEQAKKALINKTIKSPTCILVGTPGYIAPECCLDQAAVRQGNWPLYTSACDIYALGVIFFTMMVGYKPYLTAETPTEILEKTKLGKYILINISSYI